MRRHALREECANAATLDYDEPNPAASYSSDGDDIAAAESEIRRQLAEHTQRAAAAAAAAPRNKRSKANARASNVSLTFH